VRVGCGPKRFEPPPIPSFHVERVSLMRSTLGRGGAVYDQLGAYPLAGVPDGPVGEE